MISLNESCWGMVRREHVHYQGKTNGNYIGQNKHFNKSMQQIHA